MPRDLFDVETDADDDEAGSRLVVRVHLQPGSGATAVTGRHGDAIGLRVAPSANDPRVDSAVERFLAELLGVAEADVRVVSGERRPQKRVSVRNVEAPVLRRSLDDAIADASRGVRGAPGGRRNR